MRGTPIRDSQGVPTGEIFESIYDPDMARELGYKAEEEGTCPECGEWFHREVFDRPLQAQPYLITFKGCVDHGG